MPVPATFTSYIQYLKTEKRSSRHTVLAYEHDLSLFFDYMHKAYEVSQPGEVSPIMIRSWIAEMAEKGDDPKTIRRRTSGVRSFYKFMLKNGEITVNPFGKVVTPRLKKRLPVFVDETRMDNLFAALPEADTYTETLNQAILELFYATGMRLSELINLELVNYTPQHVKVMGKRSKERIIPLTESAATAIEMYLAQRKTPEKSLQNKYLFLNHKGNKLYEKFVYRVINTYLGMVTTEKKKSPHVLRHTFATHVLNKGGDLNAVKELLGHASLAATQVYTHNTINKLISIHQNAHPLERREGSKKGGTHER